MHLASKGIFSQFQMDSLCLSPIFPIDVQFMQCWVRNNTYFHSFVACSIQLLTLSQQFKLSNDLLLLLHSKQCKSSDFSPVTVNRKSLIVVTIVRPGMIITQQFVAVSVARRIIFLVILWCTVFDIFIKFRDQLLVYTNLWVSFSLPFLSYPLSRSLSVALFPSVPQNECCMYSLILLYSVCILKSTVFFALISICARHLDI